MSKNKILTVVVALLLLVILLTIVRYLTNGSGILVSPGVRKATDQLVTPTPVSVNNPPKEIKYDSSTDLKKELDSIDPKVLDEDFQ